MIRSRVYFVCPEVLSEQGTDFATRNAQSKHEGYRLPGYSLGTLTFFFLFKKLTFLVMKEMQVSYRKKLEMQTKVEMEEKYVILMHKGNFF